MLVNLVFVLLFIKLSIAQVVIPAVNLKAANYQKWAHYHWVWLKNSDGNQNNVTNFLNTYKEHGIPVGAVNIDSTWATQYNNFIVDTDKFPDFTGLVKDIHDRKMKVILWATSMINVENPDFNMTVANNYLVRDSHGVARPLKWWHGYGALLDYTNPQAVAWWHAQMDKVLDAGVDGFKCDATDPYIMEYSLTGGAIGYDGKTIVYHNYAAAYYRDFLLYTREKRAAAGTGADSGLVMSRPVDCMIDPVSKVCIAQSPRDVMFSGWVGDDDATFNGFRGCLRKLIYSSWLGYANFGCDVGGYRGGEDTKDRVVFLRWAQAMAFMPLMENGGGGEHRPWMYDEEVVDIYRSYVQQHHRLAFYLHTVGANAIDSKTSSVISLDQTSFPYGKGIPKDIKLPFPEPTTYSYRLGSDILVHPVLYDVVDEQGAAAVVQEFPLHESDKESTTWLDWWEPANLKKAHKTGDNSTAAVSLGAYSVYVRKGALIPLGHPEDSADVTNQRVVFTWFGPVFSADRTQFNMRESVTEGSGITSNAYFADETTAIATVSAHGTQPVSFDFVGVEEPSDVEVDAGSLCEHLYVDHTKTLSVSCKSNSGGLKITVSGFKSSL